MNDPLALFDQWFQAAIDSKEHQPEKMVLATASTEGVPSARVVLWKLRKQEQFYFFTNYNSQKSKELIENPKASLVFYWEKLERQVRIFGSVTKSSSEESDAYWKTRHRESRLGAIASPQSSVIQDRSIIDHAVEELSQKYPDDEIPRPAHWGGFSVKAQMIEFWQGRKFRVHDRERFSFDGTSWRREVLAP